MTSALRHLRPRVLSTVLSGSALIVLSSGCQTAPQQSAAPGQPTMKEVHARQRAAAAERNAENRSREERILSKARSIKDDEVTRLLGELKQNPQDPQKFWVLVRHYEIAQKFNELHALRLWYIENHPAGPNWPGNINPRLDRAAYEKGKALWLAHVKRSPYSFEVVSRAASYLQGGDKPLAERILQTAYGAQPNDRRWPSNLGAHYAQTLLGSAEPLTEFGVFRTVSKDEAHSLYAQDVLKRLNASKDAAVLAHTAQMVLFWGRTGRPNVQQQQAGVDSKQLGRDLIARALAIDPNHRVARSVQSRLERGELQTRAWTLSKLSAAEKAALPESDRLLVAVEELRSASRQDPAVAEKKAREVLEMAQRHERDNSTPVYADAVLQANLVLGRVAFRDGSRRDAVRYLQAAAQAPISTPAPDGLVDLSLASALIDAGEREAVAQFLETVAPKVYDADRYRTWAAQIRKGINPEFIPILSTM